MHLETWAILVKSFIVAVAVIANVAVIAALGYAIYAIYLLRRRKK